MARDEVLSHSEALKQLEWYKRKHGPYIESRGLHNWKNLFRKPNFQEILILLMLAGYFFIAQLYVKDIQACQEAILSLEADACALCNQEIQYPEQPGLDDWEDINLSGLIIKEEELNE